MKKLALFTIFVLIFGTTSTSLVSDAHAQNDPNILLRIATQADKQISNQLDRVYGDSIPSEIQTLYDQGHAAVESLENSLPDDLEQARKDFLTAMKSFMQITRMISEPVTEARLATTDNSNRDLKSELNRLHKYFESLKTVSEKHDMRIDFSEIELLFDQARQQIASGEITAANETIQKLESKISEIKKDIRSNASHSASDRVKEFVLKQLNKIKDTLTKAASADPEISELDEANALVKEIETSIYDDDISDAKKKFVKLIKIVKKIERSMH